MIIKNTVVASLIIFHHTMLPYVCRAQNLRSAKTNITKEETLVISDASRNLVRIEESISLDLMEKKNESLFYFNSSSDDVNDDYGAELPQASFELIDSEFLNEFNSECNTFKHKKTGAEIFFMNWGSGSINHTDSSPTLGFDDESTFGIFFRTPPTDSTGVPHILEHALLTGSRKYKTKEPFVDLMKSSMSTFLNAMTWNDKTGYVFASRNIKDFYNIMNVYLDAVFFPSLDSFTLAQEGWRLEPTNLDDLDNLTNVRDVELIYNGIVYNEMKAAYSNPSEILWRYTEMSLFPDSPYYYDYGGDPKYIPTLTFDNLVKFYEKFYHPSNSKIFVSGIATDHDSMNNTLSIIDEYLSEFEQNVDIKDQSKVKYQKKNIEIPIMKSYPYQAASNEEDDDIYEYDDDTYYSSNSQHIVQVSWLLNDEPLTLLEELALLVLDNLLRAESSMLNKKLVESGFGDSVVGGLSSDLIQYYYSSGLSGVHEEDVHEVEKLVIDTMKDVALKGFTDNEISAIMNSVEFQLREMGQGSGSKGILLMFSSISKWNYDYKPTDGLQFEETLSELKETIQLSGTQIFKDLINDYILHNRHRVTIHLYPSDTFDSEQLQNVTNEIEQIKESLTDKELKNIIDLAVELKKKQMQPDTKEDLATIPTLTIDDINHNLTDEYPISLQENAYDTGITLVTHDIGSTSGILYVDFLVDVSNVPFEDIQYLQLLNTLLGSVNITNDSLERNYTTKEELAQFIGMNTGGLSTQILVTSIETEVGNVVLNDENFITKLMITGKATKDKARILLQLFLDILLHSDFEDAQDEAITTLQSECSYLKHMGIAASGNFYASQRIQAKYTVAGMFGETMYGMRSVELLCDDLLPKVKNDWPHVLSKLLSIRDIVFDQYLTRSGMVINLTGDKQALSFVESDIKAFLDRLPGIANSNMTLPNFYNTTHPWVFEAKKEMEKLGESKNEAIIASTQVNYVGQGQRLYNKGESISGATDVITKYLDLDYLWHEVRVLGGAYGSSNLLYPHDGLHSFESWGDPNFVETLNVYGNVADALVKIADDLRDDPKKLELSIISSIAALDGSVLSSEMMGWTSFLRWLVRLTSDARKKWREDVLNTSPEDFELFAAKLFNTSSTVTTATVCSEAAYEEANKTIHLELVNVN